MENIKTALKITSNEVFEILEQKNVDVKVVTDILDCFIRNIEKEKQQIIDAFNEGYRNGEQETMVAGKNDVSEYDDAINYFNETFKQ